MALFIVPTPNWIGSLGDGLTEIPESGKYTLAYGYKWTQILEGLYDTIIANGNAGLYNRGTTRDGYYVINETRITRKAGQIGRVEIDWQNVYSYVNTDEWSCPPEDLRPHIERHPKYSSLIPSDFAAVQRAITAINNGSLATAINQLASTSNPTLVTNLYNKMRGGFENYYLAGARYTWTSYWVPGTLPELSQGGHTETPGGPGVLPSGFTWLRLADDPGLAVWSPVGGILKLTRSWIGSPYGYWDSDLYPPA